MASFRPQGVKDVSAQEFIKVYAAHLKSNDKVRRFAWPPGLMAGARWWRWTSSSTQREAGGRRQEAPPSSRLRHPAPSTQQAQLAACMQPLVLAG